MRRVIRPRPLAAFAFAVAVILSGHAWAQAIEQLDVALFDPLVTRSPTLERELEVSVSFEKGGEGKEAEAEVELSWRFGLVQLSLEVPFVFLSPKDGSDVGGIGDLTLGSKVRVFQSVEHAGLVSVGLDLGLPTGSERRGLGGAFTATPYVTAGKGIGPFDLIGEVGYTWFIDGADSGAQELGVNVAAAYTGWRRVTPLLEVNLVTRTRGGSASAEANTNGNGNGNGDAEDAGERSLVGRPQVYLTPGLIVSGLPGMPKRTSLRGGVQIPLTDSREFDYRILAIFNWEF